MACHHINVNLITPELTATPMNQQLRDHPNFKQQVRPAPSGNYAMEPKELTGAAVFSASDAYNQVHGLDLIVDGRTAAVQ